MAVYDILPDTNLKGVDVRDTLNANGGSVGDNFTSFFTSGANINMWSKYKPVVSTKLFHALDEWKGTGDYAGRGGFLGDNGHCGLSIAEFDSAYTLMNALNNGMAKWEYVAPKGGSEEPYRMGDFRGYCPSAYNPTGSIATNGIADTYTDCVSFNIDTGITGHSNTNLTLNDIKIGGDNGTYLIDLYFGVYMRKPSTGAIRFQTAAQTIRNGGGDLTVDVDMEGDYGDWQYAPFLSTSYQDGVNIKSGKFISCNKPLVDINVNSASVVKYTFDPIVSWHSSTQVYYEVYIYNNGSGSTTFENVRLFLMSGDDRQVENGLGELLWSSVSVPAGSSVNKSGYLTLKRDYSKSYWSKITCETPQYSSPDTQLEDVVPVSMKL